MPYLPSGSHVPPVHEISVCLHTPQWHATPSAPQAMAPPELTPQTPRAEGPAARMGQIDLEMAILLDICYMERVSMSHQFSTI